MIARTALTRPLASLLLAVLGLSWSCVHAQSSGQEIVTTPHVRAELMAHAPDGIAPGATVWAGLQLTHQPEWHTYWKNAGDSGLPTQFSWTLPPGIEAGDIAWPLPRKIPIGTLANYGYEGTVLLPVPLTITPDFKMPLLASSAKEVDIKLKASWLVCRKECIPEEGEFALRLPIRSSTALNTTAFEQSQAAQPQDLGGTSHVEVVGNALQISVDGLPPSAQGKTLEFFPEIPEVIHTAAVAGKDWTQQWDGPIWRASVPLAEHRSQSPDTLPLVLALAESDRLPGTPWGWRTVAPVTGTWPTATPQATVSPALQAALDANVAPPQPVSVSSSVFALALLGALLGGLLLNLMPCVFPVLAIKILGFAQHADDRRSHRLAGWAYTAGVVVSFLLLGAVMLGLRAAGAQLGWGFQLQSPAVVAALAALFTLLGLNLAGMFEFGQFVPSQLASAQARNPVLNNFLSGVLAVVVASPCTAPFMGASLGLAIGLPALQAMALFAALGVGLALPYLIASLVPAFARMLPRPGAWMHTLRRLLAFPMFATVAWLVWVLGQQSGIDGAGALLALLVTLSAVVWALTLAGRTRLVFACLFIALFVLLAASLGPHVWQPPQETPVAEAPNASSNKHWQPWSKERVADLTANSQPVFVDFTAAWCVTCQYNKKTTLSNVELLAHFDAKNVALLRADWTRQDPTISAALSALGRSGVPVYVLYRPGQSPVVMTEILSVDEVRSALATL